MKKGFQGNYGLRLEQQYQTLSSQLSAAISGMQSPSSGAARHPHTNRQRSAARHGGSTLQPDLAVAGPN